MLEFFEEIQHKRCLFQRFVTLTVTAKKNVKKGNGFTKQNNNFAWASCFLPNFFAVTVHISSITSRCSGSEPALRESGGNRAYCAHD